MTDVDGRTIKLSWCNWGDHDMCPGVHPEHVNVTCDCKCHKKR